MFSAVSYQLQNTGVCNADSNQLRQMVVDHLEANAALYCDFLCQPVPSEENNDTEQLCYCILATTCHLVTLISTNELIADTLHPICSSYIQFCSYSGTSLIRTLLSEITIWYEPLLNSPPSLQNHKRAHFEPRVCTLVLFIFRVSREASVIASFYFYCLRHIKFVTIYSFWPSVNYGKCM